MENEIMTKATLWKWAAAKGSWHFVTLNKTAAKWIDSVKPKSRRGFGSVPIIITIGSSTWKTSIFPDKSRGYVIPIKGNVRKKEGLAEGKTATMLIRRDKFR